MAADLEAFKKLDEQLVQLVDSFCNLVKAARPADDEHGEQGRDKRAPGELMEVLAERVLLSGHACVHIVGELKKGAMLSGFAALIEGVRSLRGSLERDMAAMNSELVVLRRDAQALLNQLEVHYYTSKHRGAPAAGQAGEELAQLCELALRATPPADGLP